MTIDTPLYDVGDSVYLRESAAMGFLEGVIISGITRNRGVWSYAVTMTQAGATAPGYYGDRASLTSNKTLYFTESEFVSKCDALSLAKANLQIQLDKIQAQIDSVC